MNDSTAQHAATGDDFYSLAGWVCQYYGREPIRIDPLPQEASHRRFFRAVGSTGTYIAMLSPPHLENNEDFLRLGRFFHSQNIPVPIIHAEDLERGFFLLEDFGTVHVAEAYESGAQEPALRCAINVLRRLQTVATKDIPPYSRQRFTDEFDLFHTWLVAGLLQQAWTPALLERINRERDQLLSDIVRQPQTVVHRDYHCRNLLWRDAQIGVIDFQDALTGPALYDLASLLHDCYWVHDTSTVDAGLKAFLHQHPLFSGIDFNQAKRWLEATAIQRQVKAVGIFARLYLRDGKATHLRHISPVLKQIQRLVAGRAELPALSATLHQLQHRVAARLEQLTSDLPA